MIYGWMKMKMKGVSEGEGDALATAVYVPGG